MSIYDEIRAGAGTYITEPTLTIVRYPFARGALTTNGAQYSRAVHLGTTDTVIEAVGVKQPAGYVLEQMEFSLAGWLSATEVGESIIWKLQASDNNLDWQTLHNEVTKGESVAAGDVSCSGKFAPFGNFLGTGASMYLRMVARTAAAGKNGKTKNSSYVELKYRSLGLAKLDGVDIPEEMTYDPTCLLNLPLHRLDGDSFVSRDTYSHLCSNYGTIKTPLGRSFDGVDDYINCGNNASLYSADYCTIEIWLNPTDAGEGGAGQLWWKQATGGTNAYMNNAPEVNVNLKTGGVWRSLLTTANSVPYKTWTHVAMVYDGANLIAYINGALNNQIAATGTIDDHSGKTLYLSDLPPGDNDFHGFIGEVRIFNRALTAQEIQDSYLETKWRYQ